MKITDKRAGVKYTADKYMGDAMVPESYTAEDLRGKDSFTAENGILNENIKQVNDWFNYFQFCNVSFREDIVFLFGDQWDIKDRSTRELSQKATLQFNFLYSMIMQLIGELRQNTPEPLVRATKATVPQEEVDVRDDLLRQLFYVNNMPIIEQNAFLYSTGGGYAAWVVELDYESNETNKLAIRVRELRDPRNAYWDAKAIEADKSDGDVCGYFTEHTGEEFHMLFPNAKSDLSFSVQSNYTQDDMRWWSLGKKVRVAHHWKKEYYPKQIVTLSNGESMPKEDAEEKLALHKKLLSKLKKYQKLGHQIPQEFMQDITIDFERASPCYKIRHYKMVMDEILEVRDWPSLELPVVFMDGQSYFQDGMQVIQSFHKFAQDEQRYMNYLRSEAAEAMLNAHNGQWLGTPGNFKGKLMELWKNPQRSKGALIADYDAKGNLPQYIPPPQISPSFESQFQMGIQNMQYLTGRHQANLGADGNEPSGKAIGLRALNGNLASFVPFDNCKRAVARTAKIMLSLFPAVYDSTMPVITRTKDGKEKRVMLNQPGFNNTYTNDMSLDGFDVTIDAGSSFNVQREAELAYMQQGMSLAPQYAPAIMDKYFANLDLPNAPEIVERMQEMMLGVPLPQIISKETGKPIPPQQPPPPNPQLLAVQQKQQEAQMENDAKMKQQQIDEQKLQLQSQEMVQDALNNHAKNVTDVMAMNRKLQGEAIKSKTELAKNHINVKTDFAKHLLTLGAQQQNDNHTANQT